MFMYDNGNYSDRLLALESEEALLERKLADSSNILGQEETRELNNKLTGIRLEKQEIEQLMTGAFF